MPRPGAFICADVAEGRRPGRIPSLNGSSSSETTGFANSGSTHKGNENDIWKRYTDLEIGPKKATMKIRYFEDRDYS